MFLGRNYLVTCVMAHRSRMRRRGVPANRRRNCSRWARATRLYAVLDFIVDNYFPIVDSFQTRLNELEHAMLGGEFRQHTIVQSVRVEEGTGDACNW